MMWCFGGFARTGSSGAALVRSVALQVSVWNLILISPSSDLCLRGGGVVQEREQEARKRMADIQKKKKEILKDREGKVLEHMEKVEANLKANRERLSKELEIKAELEKIKYEQAKDNVAREKVRLCVLSCHTSAACRARARPRRVCRATLLLTRWTRSRQAKQRQAARELEELHHDLSDIKKVRDDALDKLKRERQLQATKVRGLLGDNKVGRFSLCALDASALLPSANSSVP